MNDATNLPRSTSSNSGPPGSSGGSPHTSTAARLRLRKRQRSERRFRLCGIAAISIGIAFLGSLFVSIVSKGYPAFTQTQIALDVNLDREALGLGDNPTEQELRRADYATVVKAGLRAKFPDVSDRRDKRALSALLSPGAGFELRKAVLDTPDLIGTTTRVWLPANDDVDMFVKGKTPRNADDDGQRLKANQLDWIDQLLEQGDIERQFNTAFFTSGASRDPELAGIGGALVGSFYTLLVTLVLSFPIGVATAVYLEEFAPTNRWTDLIEVNINNLAAVPSIVFGLLGWPCSSTSSACRARRRWSAAWCLRS